MARGGARPGAGRPRKGTVKGTPGQTATSAMEWLLSVLADPAADLARKDRCAIALLPFTFRRMAENTVGVKAQSDADAAKAAATGKFRVPDPPSMHREQQMPQVRSKFLPGDPPGYRDLSWLMRAPDDGEC